MTRLKSTILAALVLFATLTGAAGSAAAAGDVTITVEDAGGNAVDGATVTLYNAADDTQANSATTGTNGEVTFSSVTDGDYYAEVTAQGYNGTTTGTMTVSGAAISKTVTISETPYADITFSETEWGEIVVSNVSHNLDYNITEEGTELPAIDLSDVPNGTEVTFDWTNVNADAFHIDNESGVPVQQDGSNLSDTSGIYSVTWDDSIDSEADAYRFEAATAYNNTDQIGTLGSTSPFAGAADAAENVDKSSLGIGVGATVLLGGVAALLLGRN
jgi:hypothetical protein